MQKLLILCCAIFIAFNLSAQNSSATTSKIHWMTNYQAALTESNATSKPILLLFTSPENCPWCVKLDSEVFQTNEFINAAHDKFIFVMIETSGKAPADQVQQNQELKRRYAVRGIPKVILITGKEQKIGETGYKAGGGKQYAEHLFKMVGDFSNYQQKVSVLEKQNFSGQELKCFYEKAQEFGLFQDMDKIMAAGIYSDQKDFFLLERYRSFTKKGQHESKEAVALKQEILNGDPKNEHMTHYHIAIIDFEALSALSNSSKKPEFLIAPLTHYIERFSKQDKTNLWRLHMIISQVYYDNGQKEKALQHADASLLLAPPLVQSEIKIVIQNMRRQLLENPIANSN